MLYTMTRTRCHSGPRAEAHLPFARDSSHTLMVLTDLGTEPSVGELWSDMMKRATKLTLLALVLTTVIILVALVKEAGENPTFRASDHDSLEERSEEHTSELQSRGHLVCRLLLEKKK